MRERVSERARERAPCPAPGLLRSLTRSLVLSLAVSSAAFAQTSISGKVIDPQSKPVGGVEVLLHAVTGSSGNRIDRDTTKLDGTFTVRTAQADTSAVYFVAVVWNGQLFVGDMMRAPFPANQDYIVQVGVNPIDVGAMTGNASATAPPPAESDRTAGVVVVIVAAMAIAAVLYFGLRRRAPARRRWLVELARIEDDLEAGGDTGTLQERRAELRARLRSPQGS